MDIFKLFFDHDLRLDKTIERNAGKNDDSAKSSIQDFLSPIPTYSKFYLTGTVLEENRFGLNCLSRYHELIKKLDTAFNDKDIHSIHQDFSSFTKAVQEIAIGHPILISSKNQSIKTDLRSLVVDEQSNIGYFKDELREPLLEGHIVIYKEQAKNGFDLHIFSKENIYKQLFYLLKELIDDSFRFFSINSKRMRSERHFYFETWTLDRPPHGAEEVFGETDL